MPAGNGWAGISLQDSMEGPLLLTAWPNAATNGVVSSFRIASNEDDSPPVVNGAFSVVDIPTGTVVNDTHMTWTFLCKGCVGDAKVGFAAQDTAGSFGMGWALADRGVSDKGDPAAVLPFHNSGTLGSCPLSSRMGLPSWSWMVASSNSTNVLNRIRRVHSAVERR
ncbi:CBD9-like protein [Lentithecium fluviatile CBS 122367]|uniref:CBD9-like protein n=1 Tax=Lentithecium fluviatile CBS 122367 TaxID=1168545 RepID=A0A6G1IGV3_9PLEO|nr:CBD9-like protein [Lentithecium fluviatile CBS 122367]